MELQSEGQREEELPHPSKDGARLVRLVRVVPNSIYAGRFGLQFGLLASNPAARHTGRLAIVP